MDIQNIKQASDELKEALIDYCRELIQTPSMPGQESEIAKLTVSKMKHLSYDRVYIDGVGNVIGLVKGSDPHAPVYMLNSHLDHVDPGDRSEWKHDPYSGDIENGNIFGRGASDTKGAFAVQVYSLEVLRRLGIKPKGDVYVTGVVLEEVGGFGTRYIMEHMDVKPDCIILGEATENNIKIGHRGAIRCKATFHGKSVHASTPQSGVNPHYAAARFLLKLEEILPDLQTDPDLGQTTVTPTFYHTGMSSDNVVPGKVNIFLDMRSAGETSEDALDIYRSIASEVCPREVKTEFRLDSRAVQSYTGLTDPLRCESVGGYKLERDNPFVRKAALVIEDTLSYSPEFEYWKFSTDGRFTAAAGIPTYGFSPCEERLAHTSNDHVNIDMMMDSLYCYAQIFL